MVCVHCRANTRVVNSRLKKNLNAVWRRRLCPSCSAVFTTEESVKYALSWVVRDKQGKIKPFSRDKLFISLYTACAHRNEATSDAGGLTETVIGNILREVKDARLTNEQIRNACLIALNRFDKAAFTYYHSYHKD
ncbi:MAG TPA: hypothetical protein VFN31_01770 [Candidatus Saccharimonadales bacterium]|nr:hypothetical protein [Candidatus Saccharimonadales bacterium]